MVGLSIVLEDQKGITSIINKKSSINKVTITKTTPASPSSITCCSSSSTTLLLPTSSFLDKCFLCKHKLLPAKDIYIYKGDTAFCSVECREIFMDEEDRTDFTNKTTKVKGNNCSSSSSSYGHKGRNRNPAFVFSG